MKKRVITAIIDKLVECWNKGWMEGNNDRALCATSIIRVGLFD